MRIALVAYDHSQNRGTGYYPPMHLCNLGTGLRRAGYDVRVFDYAGPFSAVDSYFREIADFGPTVVGLTCFTPGVAQFHRLTRQLRDRVPGTALVVGGPHPTVWPRWTLENLAHFDYAMQGECDRSIVHLAEMIEGRRAPDEVPGLVFRRRGEIVCNPADYIEDLDALPQIDRTLLDRYYRAGLYWDMAARGPLDVMITSRGCPYDCNFCFKVDRRYRFRSAEHILAEFEELHRRGVKSIHIQDDAFTINKKRCTAVAEALVAGDYRFWIKVRSRVNSVDETLLCKLKRAGVRWIIYGFESGSQIMLDSMNKRSTVAMNERAVVVTKRVGIACYGEIMVGMPGETSETIDQTIAFLLKHKPIVGNAAVLYPLPGTRVYEEARRSGTLMGDWRVDGPWPWVKLPWSTSRDDLVAEARRINRIVQRDPGTIVYFLRMHLRTMSWNQLKYLAKLARRHLRALFHPTHRPSAQPVHQRCVSAGC